MRPGLYIGLMSGTSMDGIDAALVELRAAGLQLLATHSHAYPDALRTALRGIASDGAGVSAAAIGSLHVGIAQQLAMAAGALLQQSGTAPGEVAAIGSHGQTVWHQPGGDTPFSLQLGDPGTLAIATGIPVVADFRTADMALGGQGAPLAPLFHREAFGAAGETRAVVNIGGIANLTALHADGRTEGYDLGPGNALLDDWYRRHHDGPFDAQGRFAAAGQVHEPLLAALRADAYFALPPPKSTGSDYFNGRWLDAYLAALDAAPAPADVQATLAELTAAEIARGVSALPAIKGAAGCGGGIHNTDLLQRINRRLEGCRLVSSAKWGLDPDWVEAAAFAWLAARRLAGEPGNLPAVTGARAAAPLGGLYLPAGPA